MPAHASSYCDIMLAPNLMSANDRPFTNEFQYKNDDLDIRKICKTYLQVSLV